MRIPETLVWYKRRYSSTSLFLGWISLMTTGLFVLQVIESWK